MQDDVAISGNAITGKLTKLTSGSLVDVWGEGYFIGLKFSNYASGITYADTKVGLTPSEGSGLVTLEEDGLAVMKITDKDTQKLTIVQDKAGVGKKTEYYSFAGLTLL